LADQRKACSIIHKNHHNHGYYYDDENLTDRDCEISEINTNKDLKTQLYEAIKTANTSSYGPSNAKNDPRSLGGIIKKEISLFKTTGNRRFLLKNTYDAKLTIQPTSIESERASSSAGYFSSKIRNRISDNTLDTLCFLRHYFKK